MQNLQEILSSTKSEYWKKFEVDEIYSAYKCNGIIYIETIEFSNGFAEDGCGQDSCEKLSCIGCPCATRTKYYSFAPFDIGEKLWRFFGERIED